VRGRVMILIALAIAAVLIVDIRAQRERQASADKLMSEGGTLYAEYCAECHQLDGSGWSTLYPRLAGNPIVTLHDPERIILTVTYGQGSMMSFQERLDSHKIAAILTYIRNAWGNHASPVDIRQVH
jgi:alcohol dehydrogenase (quinone), cytochrome c subunit